MKLFFTSLSLFFSILCNLSVSAQSSNPEHTPVDTTAMELDKLLQMNFTDDQLRGTVKQQEIGLASVNIQKEQEVPSIVSVISRKEILSYGFRDLTDILRTIPGFEFGIDGTNLFGWGFRGIWVYEGKGSLMINNIPVNDYAYGNVNFIGSYPAAMIERVEIIRGPGSVLHGGFSEVTVVNIITRNERDGQYVRFNTNGYSLDGKEFGGGSNVSFGGNVNEIKFNTSIGYSVHPTSAKTYTDFWGDTLQYGLKNASRQWFHIISDISFKDFTVKYHHIDFNFTGQDGYTKIIPVNERNKNSELLTNYSDAILLQYKKQVSNIIKIEPVVEYSRGNPINGAATPHSVVTGELSGIGAITHHIRGNFNMHFNFKKYGELSLGSGYTRDIMMNMSREGEPGLFGNDTLAAHYTYSRFTESVVGFAQYTIKLSPMFSMIAGNRLEKNTFGTASAPRIGFVFERDRFNTKLLYGHAYRIPMPWQAYSRWVSFNDQLKPETSENYEIEIGYSFSDNISAKANSYFIDIKDPIIWNGSNLQYSNTGRIQSMGVEGNLLFNYNYWGGFFNVAYSKPGKKSSGDYLTADKHQTIGLPPLKMNLGFNYRFKKVQLAPALVFLSKRYGQTQAFAQMQALEPATREFASQSYPEVLLVNCNLIYKNLMPGMNLNFSIYNIFDAQYVLIQPYYAGHAPVPTNDRQFTVGISYDFTR
jgi:outer membrane receptor for ferrienterochelin and colicin